jgi:thiol-disulfide isomerase/thioredoxin
VVSRVANILRTGAVVANRRKVLMGMGLIGSGVVLPTCGSFQVAPETGADDMPSRPKALHEGRGAKVDGRQAADFTLEVYQGAELLGASVVQFRDVLGAGMPVVLNFWAAQCAPCRFELPDLQRVYEATRARVLFVGLDIGPFVGLGSLQDGRALVSELGVTYPVGTTWDAGVVNNYRVLGMPTTIFITPSAEIVRHWTGRVTASAVRELVDELIKASRR